MFFHKHVSADTIISDQLYSADNTGHADILIRVLVCTVCAFVPLLASVSLSSFVVNQA